jgi:hypothetical protein
MSTKAELKEEIDQLRSEVAELRALILSHVTTPHYTYIYPNTHATVWPNPIIWSITS